MKNSKLRRSHIAYQHTQQSGFALIEVLISAVILSVGLLGLAGLQVIGMKSTQHAYMKTQATVLTQHLLEKIRANPNGDYEQVTDCTKALPSSCDSATTSCSINELAAYDLYRAQCGTQSGGQLVGGVRSLLTSGAIQIACTSGNCDDGLTITTSWVERITSEDEKSSSSGTAVNNAVPKKLELTAKIR